MRLNIAAILSTLCANIRNSAAILSTLCANIRNRILKRDYYLFNVTAFIVFFKSALNLLKMKYLITIIYKIMQVIRTYRSNQLVGSAGPRSAVIVFTTNLTACRCI